MHLFLMLEFHHIQMGFCFLVPLWHFLYIFMGVRYILGKGLLKPLYKYSKDLVFFVVIPDQIT